MNYETMIDFEKEYQEYKKRTQCLRDMGFPGDIFTQLAQAHARVLGYPTGDNTHFEQAKLFVQLVDRFIKRDDAPHIVDIMIRLIQHFIYRKEIDSLQSHIALIRMEQ